MPIVDAYELADVAVKPYLRQAMNKTQTLTAPNSSRIARLRAAIQLQEINIKLVRHYDHPRASRTLKGLAERLDELRTEYEGMVK